MPEEINNKLSYAFGVPFVFFINNELTEELRENILFKDVKGIDS